MASDSRLDFLKKLKQKGSAYTSQFTNLGIEDLGEEVFSYTLSEFKESPNARLGLYKVYIDNLRKLGKEIIKKQYNILNKGYKIKIETITPIEKRRKEVYTRFVKRVAGTNEMVYKKFQSDLMFV